MGEKEIQRLAGRPPLVTILILMIGPLCSQITSTLYGIINTIWISKYIGESGMSAVATDIAWEGIARSFDYSFLSQQVHRFRLYLAKRNLKNANKLPVIFIGQR